MSFIILKIRRALLLISLFPFAATAQHGFNANYLGKNVEKIAFPIGGMGAGMFTLEGSGAISHLSIRHNPDFFNEPPVFAAICIKGQQNISRVLEGPVPEWKKFGQSGSGFGAPGTTWGLPRFKKATFITRFPFAEIKLIDQDIPLSVSIKGWSPFIPTDADNSSLPVGALEYTFINKSTMNKESVFTYNSKIFRGYTKVAAINNGFEFYQSGTVEKPEEEAHLAFFTDDENAIVDHSWIKGGWFDALTVSWKNIQAGVIKSVPPKESSAGASIQIPFSLKPNERKTIRVMIAWYVPESKLLIKKTVQNKKDSTTRDGSVDLPSKFHKPWYCSKFKHIGGVVAYWRSNYTTLKKNTQLFTDAFYKSSLSPEVTEAVAANLTILKSTTVLRQYDGRLWTWEGSGEREGAGPGSCTHVWNYAQALPHLFPAMERTLRETEFNESQNADGHQMFRAGLPISPIAHDFYAAADGQLGGIMKVYREWRISGDDSWMKELYPKIKSSLNYCIKEWDTGHTGTLEEPHHNTYDIEFWGAEPMCTGFYLGALKAFIKISDYLNEDCTVYKEIYAKGKNTIENNLYNGEYFFQKIQWTGLNAPDPVTASKQSIGITYSEEAIDILKKEGPKYQYGSGVLSDGMLGAWLAMVCGLEMPFDKNKIASHLQAVYKYNFKKNLSTYSNTQRPGFAMGDEGGLILCTWPKNDKLSLPFVYSDEVWTGIEYEVASHLIFMGKIKEGLEIVRTARNRYDGKVRNPFDEYEYGNWYARAMSSYALIKALTGVRYDAVEKALYVDSKVGDFVSFISTDTGFGNVIYKNGKAEVKVVYGKIDVQHINIKK